MVPFPNRSAGSSLLRTPNSRIFPTPEITTVSPLGTFVTVWAAAPAGKAVITNAAAPRIRETLTLAAYSKGPRLVNWSFAARASQV